LHQQFVCIFEFTDWGGVLEDRAVCLTLAAKEVTESNAPVGAALIAQAMDRREGAGRYKAMQSIMDWDHSRLAYRAVKRAFDIVFSGVVLVVIAIPSLVLAAAIRLESEGSSFYSQIRVGQTRPDGSLTTFRMWKFRSMYKDADERLAELKDQNEIAGAMFKMKNNPRITRIGKFIRKHSIDEFPQFLNVFLGQMSVVGPRPPLPSEVAEYTEYDLQRLAVKPGITGWWQVTERNSTGFDGMVRRDLEYIAKRGILFDLKIILLTVIEVVSGNGAF
jgi:lipopolysaccharide/colanic/teichoic acid biosynthesis glycosyltransferase